MNQNDNIVTPKLHRTGDLYQAYVRTVMHNNPDYYTKWNVKRQISNFWIYRRATPGEPNQVLLISKKKKGKDTRVHVVEVMNFDRWRNILIETMKEAIVQITNGEELIVSHELGRIAARRIGRNYKNKVVNWKETNKLPKKISEKSGKLVPERMVYFLDEDYIRVGWKKEMRVLNEMVYEFKPSEGPKGFSTFFSNANIKNKLLKYTYEFFPFKIYSNDIR